MFRLPQFFTIFLSLTLTVFAAGDDVPSWVTQFKNVKNESYDNDVNAVVLQNDQVVTVGSDGKTVTTITYAVRILNRNGKREAIAVQPYLVSSGKVRDFKGWLVRSDGITQSYGKDRVLDVISDPDDIYNEYRKKVIDASSDADVNSIFAYQVTTEDAPLFDQDVYYFQDNLPTLLSRYTLNLPNGWKAESYTFNRARIAPAVSGTSYSWEVRNLPPIADEPESPTVKNLVPHIAVNYAPEINTTNFRSFKSWTDVSRWNSQLSDPSVVINDEVAAKARELTANAKSEFEKIHAVGTFVQNLQYISIDIGVGKGNGYRPRPSTLVLQRGYGDCKDKANLMRAMLKALKIEAYPVAIFSGDKTFVREEWASPMQFNHCIIAVKVSDETQSPTIITHPRLGRLLIFDATDELTPVGDLPDYLQDSYALIVAGENGGLAKMPVTSPDVNKMERFVDMTLGNAGEINGQIRENASGQQAVSARRMLRRAPLAEYNKIIERWVSRGVPSANISKINPVDKNAENKFELEVNLKSASYGQLMQNRLLIFKPVIVDRLNSLWLTETKRTQPVVMDSTAFAETAVFNLPAGFTVDETPDATNLETPFGTYSANYEIKDDKLVFKRSLILKATTIPVEKYSSVKDFFVKIRSAEQSPVVLVKK